MMAFALLAAGTVPAPPIPVVPLDYQLAPPKRSLRIVPSCDAEVGEIVVCGRRASNDRVAAAGAAATTDGRRFDLEILPGVRLVGGGPKNSVGLGLRIDF